MDEDILNKYQKAGQIAIEAKKLARERLKPGVKLLDLADEIENKILELGGKIAFPVNLSLNEEAAHSVPSWRDQRTYEDGDLIKVDLGVHVDGYIADTAFSFSTDPKDKKLIESTQEALKNAIEIVKPGTKLRDIGKEIYKTISSYGFKPIVNLTGHSLEQYNLHSGMTIPSYDNKSEVVLKEGMAIAIEPFATTGSGIVIEGKEGEVLRLTEKSARVRNGRDMLKWILNEKKHLPFSRRELMNKFNPLKTKLAVKELIRKGIFNQYKVLREKSKGRVSQTEHTLVVKDKPIVTTRGVILK